MTRLATAIALAALACGCSAHAGPSPYTAKATSACLSDHRVLASVVPLPQVLPATLRQHAAGALQISFALVPARSLDNAHIVFTASPERARALAKAWFTSSMRQTAGLVGRANLAKAHIRLHDVFLVKGNAVVAWGNAHVEPASKKVAARCLR